MIQFVITIGVDKASKNSSGIVMYYESRRIFGLGENALAQNLIGGAFAVYILLRLNGECFVKGYILSKRILNTASRTLGYDP